MVTRVGDNCLLMVGAHVAHDCTLGDHVIMANNATLAGHVTIGDYAIVGGLSAVHQYVRIGPHAMVGGMSGVEFDVIPYGSVLGDRARLCGLNLVGLKRRGFSKDDIDSLRKAYRMLFAEEGTIRERVEDVASEFSDSALVNDVLEFIRAAINAQSSRSLTQPLSLQPQSWVFLPAGDLPLRIVAHCENVAAFLRRRLQGPGLRRRRFGDAPHTWVRLGAAGATLSALHDNGVREVVFAGGIRRPSLAALAARCPGLKFFAKLDRAAAGRRRPVAAIVATTLEDEEGLSVVGVDTSSAASRWRPGPLARTLSGRRGDARYPAGIRILTALGRCDVGQAVVVQDGLVLGIEAVEGTDALLDRCGRLRYEGRGGVLVKLAKPGQDPRADLPTIGPAHRARGQGPPGCAASPSRPAGRWSSTARTWCGLADAAGLFVVAHRSWTMRPDGPLIFLVAGEPSGDALGGAPDGRAETADGRRGQVRRRRRRGAWRPKGLKACFPMSDLSIIGVFEVVPHARRIFGRMAETAAAVDV